MTKQSKTFTAPTDEEISFYAYCLWEADGRQHGKHNEHWFQARAQLMAHRQEIQQPVRPAPAVVPDIPKAAMVDTEERQKPRRRAPKASVPSLAAA